MTSWSPEHVEMLKTLWRAGHSASYVAGELSDSRTRFTRNSVISKLHRLGISDRDRDVGRDKRVDKATGFKAPKKRSASPFTWHAPTKRQRKPPTPPVLKADDPEFEATEETQIAVAPAELVTNAKPLLALGEGQCRWPVADTGLFCGQNAVKRGAQSYEPYCGYHLRRSWQRASSR